MDRLAGRRDALRSLDLLASSASAREPLESRLNWLVDLVQWIRRPGHDQQTAVQSNLPVQAGRLRRFFDVLDRNPEWKRGVAQTLRSIIRETRALELLSETGLPRQSGLFSEAGERLARKFLPPVPGSAELGVLFDRLFPYRGDAAWIEKLDDATLGRFCSLLEFEVGLEEKDWFTLEVDLEDALFHLASHLAVSGCSGAIRSRIDHEHIRDLPFFKLGGVLQSAFAARENRDQETLVAELNYLQLLVDGCHKTIAGVMEHLETRGVSTGVVYQLAFLEASLARFESLRELVFLPDQPLTRVGGFVAALIRENRARESVVDLLRQNFRLLTRKVVERNAGTGEHYIARTRAQYAEMVRSAAGGGVIMAFTTWFKTIILGWSLPGLLEGFAASLNYASGFLAIQFTGSTLATKQPANTAPALAARMHQVRQPKALEALTDEIVWLIRSQIAAIAGNIALVVPTVLIIHFLILTATGAPMLSTAKAAKAVNSVSILGPSLFYAAFTGVLLWASSLAAAWADNWFVYNHIGQALESDRQLLRILGPSRAVRFARFWKKNMAGLGGNVSFGLMLGLIPELAAFAGLPLDIRHVTLSSSLLAASAASLGPGLLATRPFWLAVLGIMGIGFMNLTISFSLALFVAIRARDVGSPETRAILKTVFRRLLRKPLSFILPVGGTGTNPDPAER